MTRSDGPTECRRPGIDAAVLAPVEMRQITPHVPRRSTAARCACASSVSVKVDSARIIDRNKVAILVTQLEISRPALIVTMRPDRTRRTFHTHETMVLRMVHPSRSHWRLITNVWRALASSSECFRDKRIVFCKLLRQKR